jgi:hypothetical protein
LSHGKLLKCVGGGKFLKELGLQVTKNLRYRRFKGIFGKIPAHLKIEKTFAQIRRLFVDI